MASIVNCFVGTKIRSSLKLFLAVVMFSGLLKTTVECNKMGTVDTTKTALNTNENSNEKRVIHCSICSAILPSAVWKKEEDKVTRNTCCEGSK